MKEKQLAIILKAHIFSTIHPLLDLWFILNMVQQQQGENGKCMVLNNHSSHT